jgi:hypothetical protein
MRELAREVALGNGVDLEIRPEGDREYARLGVRRLRTGDDDEECKHDQRDEERPLHDANQNTPPSDLEA